jgi:hypothetical protein
VVFAAILVVDFRERTLLNCVEDSAVSVTVMLGRTVASALSDEAMSWIMPDLRTRLFTKSVVPCAAVEKAPGLLLRFAKVAFVVDAAVKVDRFLVRGAKVFAEVILALTVLITYFFGFTTTVLVMAEDNPLRLILLPLRTASEVALAVMPDVKTGVDSVVLESKE